MKAYKIKYWDREGQGTTIIESSDSQPIEIEEAAAAIKEYLLEKGIDTGEVQIEEFREIQNPFDRLVTNFQRLGF